MNDIILPITCRQIQWGLYALLGIGSLIGLILNDGVDDIKYALSIIGGVFFVVIGWAILLMLYAEGKFPHFPIRCKCK